MAVGLCAEMCIRDSIDRDLIVSAQREALQTLRCIISNLEYRFYKAYGMEIEDKRTVYGAVSYTHLDVYKRQPRSLFLPGRRSKPGM